MNRSRRALLLVAISVAACAEGDAPGKQVLDWKAGRATSLHDVTLGKETTARAVKDVELVLRSKGVSGDTVLSFHVDIASVEPVHTPSPEAVIPTTLDVPIAVASKVVSANGFRVSGACRDPSFEMPSLDAERRHVHPKALFTECTLSLRYESITKDLDERAVVDVFGDGRVAASYAGGTAVVR